VEIEQRLAAVTASQAVLVETVINDLRSRTRDEEHMRRVMLHTLREHNDGWQEWTKAEALQIGTKLIELLIEATKIAHSTCGRRLSAPRTSCTSTPSSRPGWRSSTTSSAS
jgi:hypothetical protein